jgi:hypothetical protein
MSASAQTMAASLPPSSRVHRHEDLGRQQADAPAGAHAAGKTHHVAVAHQGFTRGAGAGHEAQHRGQAFDARDDAFEHGHKTRRGFRRLDDHRAAGHERGNSVDHRQDEREVPGADDAGDTIGPPLRFDRDVRDPRPVRCFFCQQARGIVQPAPDGADGALHFHHRLVVPARVGGNRRGQGRGVGRHRVGQLRQASQAVRQRQGCPGRLRLAQGLRHGRHLFGVEDRHVVVGLAGARVARGEHLLVIHGRTLHAGSGRRSRCAG